MATYDEISRIAKILARATSANEAEAIQCIQSAYKRMVRDNVTLENLLTLPVQELYQASLNRLVDHIINLDTTMSPSEKRRLYAKQISIIALKFLEEDDVDLNQQYHYKETAEPKSGANDEPPKGKTRAEEAKGYHERHGNTGNQNNNANQSQNTHHNGTNNTQGDAHTKNTQTPHQEPKNHHPDPKSQTFTVFGHTFSFSPATFLASMAESFGRGSFFHACFTQPLAGLNLLYVSFIFSIIIATILMLTLGLIYAIVPFTVPNISFSTAFAALATASIVIKARQLFLSGWFG